VYLFVSVEDTVGLKISAHFYFVSKITQRVFNSREPALAYDTAQSEEIVISYSKIERAYVAVELFWTQNRNCHFFKVEKLLKKVISVSFVGRT